MSGSDVDESASMRLAVLTSARLTVGNNWTTLREPLLEPLAAHPGGRLIAPPELRTSELRDWKATVSDVRRCDAVFWMQMSSRPETAITLASLARPRTHRSAVVIDAWRSALPKIGTLAVAQRLRPCFVFFREGFEELSRSHPRGSFEWIPFGVDTDVFHNTGQERDIFAYWMGRRYPPLHEALIEYCAARGLEYRYTTGAGVADPAELGRIVARSRYFVVTPPDLDNPTRTGGFSPLVMRYLEGLAAGTRLLGVRPRSGELEDLLPTDAMLEVRPDGRDLAERLDADQADPSASAAAAAACELVRREHSWARRADQIHERLLELH